MKIELRCGNCGEKIEMCGWEIKDDGTVVLSLNEDHVCREKVEESDEK